MANETITDQTAIDAVADGDFFLADDLSASGVSKKVSGAQISTYVGTKNLSNLANASTARTNLGVAIGTDVLAEQTIGIADNNLLEVDGTPNAAEYARFTANGLEGRTEAEFKSDFNLEIGTDVQAYDAELAALAGLTSAANKLPYFTGSETASVTDLTAAARTMIGSDNLVVQKTQTSVSSAEILALHTTPKTLVAAKGAGKILLPLYALLQYTHVTTAYSDIIGSDNFLISVAGGSSGVAVETVGFVDQTSSSIRFTQMGAPLGVSNIEVIANAAIELSLNGAITTGDGTLVVDMWYIEFTI